MACRRPVRVPAGRTHWRPAAAAGAVAVASSRRQRNRRVRRGVRGSAAATGRHDGRRTRRNAPRRQTRSTGRPRRHRASAHSRRCCSARRHSTARRCAPSCRGAQHDALWVSGNRLARPDGWTCYERRTSTPPARRASRQEGGPRHDARAESRGATAPAASTRARVGASALPCPATGRWTHRPRRR
eukprot:scaffold13913_cov64-Phaeocystis_antarctica.AAC.7